MDALSLTSTGSLTVASVTLSLNGTTVSVPAHEMLYNGGSQIARVSGEGLPVDLLNGGTVAVGNFPATQVVAGTVAISGTTQINQIINPGVDYSANNPVTVNAGTIIYNGNTLVASKTIAAGGSGLQFQNNGTAVAIAMEGTGTAATPWIMNAGDVGLLPTKDQVVTYVASGQFVAVRGR